MKMLNVVKFDQNAKVRARTQATALASQPFLTAKAKRKKTLEWLGPCASFICLIHCFGTAAIAVLAPGFLEILPHAEWVEAVIFGVAGFSGILTLLRTQIRGVVKLVFSFFFTIGLAGLALHVHSLLHVSLLGMAFLQLYVLLVTHRPGAKEKPACCLPTDSK